MKQPIRIQRSRQHKQISPNGLPIVYCGRPGKYGNPFQVHNSCQPFAHCIGLPHLFCHDVEQVLENYEWYLKNTHDGKTVVELAKKELKGKNLSCWCSLKEKCHADILLKLVNS